MRLLQLHRGIFFENLLSRKKNFYFRFYILSKLTLMGNQNAAKQHAFGSHRR